MKPASRPRSSVERPSRLLLAGLAGVLWSPGCGGGGADPRAPEQVPPPAVSLAIGDATTTEGDTGTTWLQFPVSVTGTLTADVTVPWATSDGTATAAGADYAPDSGVLTFSPGGPTTHTVSILVTGDGNEEADEVLYVDLGSPGGPGATIADGRALGTIVNDDTRPPGVWPARVFAPYVDMGLWPVADLVQGSADAEAAGAVHMDRYVLAFVTAGGTKTTRACWAGQDAYEVGNPGAGMPDHGALIAALQAEGGEVMVSFGGAIGTPLAVSITDVDALVAEYERVIAAYHLTCIDFDIEGLWAHYPTQSASIDRRSRAMRILQDHAAAEGRPLEIWLTFAVLPTGLTTDGLAIVQSAVDAGVELRGVNVMCMDYGLANYTGDAGESAILAGTRLFEQLQAIYAKAGIPKSDAQLWAMVGLTPMIGVNDVQDIVFTQADAREVLDFANAKGIGLLSMWSAHRDRGAAGAQVGQVSPTHSGLDASGTVTRGVTHTPHTSYEFMTIWSPFTQ